MSERWRIRVDTGGTFTDCWGLAPGSKFPLRAKCLSSSRLRLSVVRHIASCEAQVALPEGWRAPDGFFVGFQRLTGEGETAGVVTHWAAATRTLAFDSPLGSDVREVELTTGEEAPVLGARLLTGTGLSEEFPDMEFRLATTRATNAALERKGARVAFLVTKGFGDLLLIGDQRRPEIFAREIVKKRPLYECAVEIDERLDRDGEVVKSLSGSLPALRETLRELRSDGVEALAVALLNGYANPAHEQMVRELGLEVGFEFVSVSSSMSTSVKLLPRAETAVVDAYLTPVLSRFLERVSSQLGGCRHARVMSSAGGLEPMGRVRAKDGLLSGPAGGVVGAAAVARACGFPKIISFDMGGTSADVARVDSDYVYQFQHTVGDSTVMAPALRIETVAAGGGSICQWTGDELRVGPESAGAYPGPASYGRGGPLTLTDVNLLLGRIDPEKFSFQIDDSARAAARGRLNELMAAMRTREPETVVLNGLLRIAIERMADRIREISVREGADTREYTLVAFGGAGPLHACDVAGILGVETILVPRDAGLLSAVGLDAARMERFAERLALSSWDSCVDGLKDWVADLEADCIRRLRADGVELGDIREFRRIGELRFRGQETVISVEGADPALWKARFLETYQERYGYTPESREVELVTLRTVVSSATESYPEESFLGGGVVELKGSARFFDRSALVPGDEILGPALITDPFCVIRIGEGWRAVVGSAGTILARREQRAGSGDAGWSEHEIGVEAVRELFRRRFENVVAEMGASLEKSAISTNIKERLDFSCAFLDREGRLVVNAPHIPVHLGALGECVRRVSESVDWHDGDMMVTNHPKFGGSHLPDVTVISPIFSCGDLIGFVANRAHHAEIGGIRPGSMPPNATCLAEEGVVIPPTYLFEGGISRFGDAKRLFAQGLNPTRRLNDNLADLQAQVAANRRGVALIQRIVSLWGIDGTLARIDEIMVNSEERFAKALEGRALSTTSATEVLDGGERIQLTLALTDGKLVFDFSGTAAESRGNMNATPAIVTSAILYCLRLWVGEDMPLNEGPLNRIEIRLPRCFLNPFFDERPEKSPAVVGGNVETSQRLVDTIFRALEFQAASQGTMNNLIFGDGKFGYYETIAGGAGAGASFGGASAVHTHMTNTAITDPEILELRYPVSVERFAIRRGSGGRGARRGGDGVIRELRFHRPLQVSMLTQRRMSRPYGLRGGEGGEPGAQFLKKKNGHVVELPSVVAMDVEPGDVLEIRTPGGGGYGAP